MDIIREHKKVFIIIIIISAILASLPILGFSAFTFSKSSEVIENKVIESSEVIENN